MRGVSPAHREKLTDFGHATRADGLATLTDRELHPDLDPHRAVELERPDLAQRGDILGAILAHEIGHLLIAGNNHSNIGILRARWDDQDLRLIAQGRIMFTMDQAARMLSLTAERQAIPASRPSGASTNSGATAWSARRAATRPTTR